MITGQASDVTFGGDKEPEIFHAGCHDARRLQAQLQSSQAECDKLRQHLTQTLARNWAYAIRTVLLDSRSYVAACSAQLPGDGMLFTKLNTLKAERDKLQRVVDSILAVCKGEEECDDNAVKTDGA